MRISYASSTDSESSSEEADQSYLATKKPVPSKSSLKLGLKSNSNIVTTSPPRVTFAASTPAGPSQARTNQHQDSSSSGEDGSQQRLRFGNGPSAYRPGSHKKALAYWASLDPPMWSSSSLVNMKSSLQSLSSFAPPQRPQSSSQSQARISARQAELEEINSLLSNISLTRDKEAAALHAAFEERNRSLWDSIEGAIAAKEEEARAAQQREAEVLAQARAKQEAAEKAAKDAKDKALKEQAEEAAREKEQARLKAEAEAKASKNNVGKQMWSERRDLIMRLKEVGPAVVNNPDWRKPCRDAKRIITPKVGQVTNSMSHIQTIAQQISSALASLQTIEQPYLWALNHLAKALIQQAETELTARVSAAFPLARLTQHLFALHPQLASVLIARLSKKCFYLTSFLPPRSAYASDQAYAKALGLRPGEGLMESASRLRGIVALFSAIVAVADQSSSTAPKEFRPDAAWTFLAGLARPELSVNGRQDAAPGLYDTAFELLGFKMSIYGQQWQKLWKAVKARLAEWPMSEGWVKASVKRLELRLEEWESKGPSQPEGYQAGS